MSKKITGNYSHLTQSDRIYIEQELNQGNSFKSIAKVLQKDPTTISKEVKRSRDFYSIHPYWKKCRLCWNYIGCRERNCYSKSNCNKVCRYCFHKDPTKYCSYFIPYICYKPNKAPYVCNSRDHHKYCPLDKALYSATSAQKKYEKKLVESRKGINLTSDELQQLNDLVSDPQWQTI